MSFEDERVENSVDTQIFAFDYYLRENLAEVLSCALTYTVIYRPEDPIEFISEFLIHWSQKRMDQQALFSTMNKSEENDRKDSLKEISSQSDNHLSSFQHEASSFDLPHDNEQKPIPRQFLHLHDTATDDHQTDLSYFSQLREKIIKCDEF